MEVRFAKENELDRVNELRKQVNDVHVAGKPDVFKPGFCDELKNFINVIRIAHFKEGLMKEQML